MPRKVPKTVAEYISDSPRVAQPHLRKLRAILRSVAPHAEEVIKWGVPFFIDPRFIYSFSAFKAHCVLAPTPAALKAFRKELAEYDVTANYLKLRYDEPLPEALLRRIAEYRLRNMGPGDSFW